MIKINHSEWDIGPREVLRLCEKEREYIETGTAPGGYSTAKIEERINNTVKAIPARINILIEDIEFLKNPDSSVVSSEHWRDCWLECLGVEDMQSATEIKQAYTFSPTENSRYPTSGLVEFGEQFGRLAKHLHLIHDENTIYKEMNQIVLGFINGLYGQRPADSVPGEYRHDNVHAVIESLESWSDELAEIDKIKKSRKSGIHQKAKEKEKEAQKKIEEILEEANIKHPSTLVFPIIHKLDERYPLSEETASSTIYHGTGNWSVENKITSEIVMEIVESEQLIEKRNVYRLINNDGKRLMAQKWRGVDASHVIECLYQGDHEYMSSAQINDELDNSKDYIRQISKITTDLSGRKWDERPLLSNSESGWRLTKYGEAIGYSVAEKHQLASGEQFPGAPPEDVVEGVLDELNRSWE